MFALQRIANSSQTSRHVQECRQVLPCHRKVTACSFSAMEEFSLNWNFQLLDEERANNRRYGANETPIVSKRKQRFDLEIVLKHKQVRGCVSCNSSQQVSL